MHKQLSLLHRFIVMAIVLVPICFAMATIAAPSVKKIGLFPEDCISADELRAKQMSSEKLVVLDARSQISYDQGHIKDSVLARTDDYYKKEKLFRKGTIQVRPDADAALVENLKKYPKNTLIVTYCGDGCKASAAMLIQIRRLGFNNVKVMDDGFETWERKGYPVEKGMRNEHNY